jgi:hypothetical protein
MEIVYFVCSDRSQQLRINTMESYKMYIRKNGQTNAKSRAIAEIYEAYISV